MHKVADEIQANIRIPLSHIADATAQKITSLGLKKIGLLGTRFTIEEDFYKGRLINKYGLEVIILESPEREIVHRVIYDELCLSIIHPTSKAQYISIMQSYCRADAADPQQRSYPHPQPDPNGTNPNRAYPNRLENFDAYSRHHLYPASRLISLLYRPALQYQSG